MISIDQVKLIGIPKNTSRLNNKAYTPSALPNESVNLYEAVTVILDDLNVVSAGTDLTIVSTPVNISLNSSTGNGVVFFPATITTAGLLSAADKINLESLISLSGVNAGSIDLGSFTGTLIADNSTIKSALQQLETVIENTLLPAGTDLSATAGLSDVTIISSTGADAVIPAATNFSAGVMTAVDKTTLSNVNVNISNLYSLIGVPTVGSTTLGLFTGNIIPNNTSIAIALQSLETAIESGAGAGDGNGIYTGSGVIASNAIAEVNGSFTVDNKTVQANTISIGNVTGAGFLTRIGQLIEHNAISIGGVFGQLGNSIKIDANKITVNPDAGIHGIDLFSGGTIDVRFSNSGVTFYRMTGTGSLKYGEDYSANFVDRSLVDKAYVDSKIGVNTNISVTHQTNQVVIASSTGTDGILTPATSSFSGALSAADKRKLDALVTLSGMPAESVNLGQFTGTIIQDNSTVKSALQEIETYLDAYKTGGGYITTNGPNYILEGGNRTVFANANSSNIFITAGGGLLEGEIYYLYTRRDLSFTITINAGVGHNIVPINGNSGPLTTNLYTIPYGSGQTVAHLIQRRGNSVFITLLS